MDVLKRANGLERFEDVEREVRERFLLRPADMTLSLDGPAQSRDGCEMREKSHFSPDSIPRNAMLDRHPRSAPVVGGLTNCLEREERSRERLLRPV